MISIRLDPGIERWLTDVARRSGKSESECVWEAIVGYLEDFDDSRIASQRLEEPAKLWTLDELDAELDVTG